MAEKEPKKEESKPDSNQKPPEQSPPAQTAPPVQAPSAPAVALSPEQTPGRWSISRKGTDITREIEGENLEDALAKFQQAIADHCGPRGLTWTKLPS